MLAEISMLSTQVKKITVRPAVSPHFHIIVFLLSREF